MIDTLEGYVMIYIYSLYSAFFRSWDRANHQKTCSYIYIYIKHWSRFSFIILHAMCGASKRGLVGVFLFGICLLPCKTEYVPGLSWVNDGEWFFR